MNNIKITYQFNRDTEWNRRITEAIQGVKGSEELYQHFRLAPCDGQIKVNDSGLEFSLRGSLHSIQRWVQRLEKLSGLKAPNKLLDSKQPAGSNEAPANQSKFQKYAA